MKIISPMYDFMFKRMFSIPDNKNMLCDFLDSFIDFKNGELRDVKLIDKEIKRTKQEKESTLDLRVEVGNPETGLAEVDVEVQLQDKAAFKDRIMYYLTKMFADQLGEGEPYTKLHKCVSLCVLNFPMFNDKQFFRSMLMRDTDGNVLTDKLEFDCLEVSKIHNLELTGNTDKKLQWAKLFAASSEEELDMIKDTINNPAIDQAVLTIKKLSASEEMRYEALAREKAERDRITMLADATNKGLAKGKAEGRAEGKAEVAANLRAMGMSEEQIMLALNGSISKVVEDNTTDEDDNEEFEP